MWMLVLLSLALAQELTPDQRSNHWLVIVHSSKFGAESYVTAAHESSTAPVIEKLRSAGISPIALNSSRYKQLMPCWKILIAGSSAKKSTARALSKKLTASGIDNYVKQAGKYVGADPRIDRMCNNAAQQVPDSPYAIAQTSNGGVLVRIPVREPTLQHLIERYDQTLREQDRYGYELWMEKLPVETVDAARAGQNFQVLALRQGAEPQSCSVEHFVLAEEGVSVGYPDEVDGKKPRIAGCSEHKVYAFLSCPQPFSTSELVFTSTKTSLPQIWAIGASTKRAHNPNWFSEELAQAQRHAQDQEAPLQLETLQHALIPIVKGERQLQSLVSTKLYTNEGNNICAGEDLNLRLTSTFADNQPLHPFAQIFDYGELEDNILGVVQPENGSLQFVISGWPRGYGMVDESGNLSFENFVSYCGCDC